MIGGMVENFVLTYPIDPLSRYLASAPDVYTCTCRWLYLLLRLGVPEQVTLLGLEWHDYYQQGWGNL